MIRRVAKAFSEFEVHMSFDVDAYRIYDTSGARSPPLTITHIDLEEMAPRLRGSFEIPWKLIIRHKLGSIYKVHKP